MYELTAHSKKISTSLGNSRHSDGTHIYLLGNSRHSDGTHTITVMSPERKSSETTGNSTACSTVCYPQWKYQSSSLMCMRVVRMTFRCGRHKPSVHPIDSFADPHLRETCINCAPERCIRGALIGFSHNFVP